MKRVSTSCAMLALFTLVFSCSSAPPPDELSREVAVQGLSTPRKLMPLVELADGRVLAAGGHDGSRSLSSCEVYDAEKGGWLSTGAMRTARRNHAAVRMTDGRVLVAGGTYSASFGALASAEVYEPGTGRWTQVADMAEARNDPAAVALPDGRVLVAGGFDVDRHPVRSAELFDPATGRWTRTGAPTSARSGAQTGVVLGNGKVLFVSGLQAELYDVASGQWAKAGPVGGAAGTHRSGHSVTLLPDGRVLVVGGTTSRAAATAELYEPVRGEWKLAAAPVTPREAHGALVTGEGRVLVAGGFHVTSGALASVESYDPAADTWSAEPTLQAARRGAGMVLLEDGAVLLVGGSNDLEGTLATSERYDPGVCMPLTCEAAGQACGVVADGCGGTLECGPCEVAPACGAEGCGVERAEYDAELRAPRCDEVSAGCSSGGLLVGRGLLGPEPNMPNALWGTCGDGEGGARERDEALEALRVTTVDGGNLAPGKMVRVEATVWAYAEPEANRLDLYSAADARNPAWTYLTTLSPAKPGSQVLTATYVLPAGSLQAVRGVFRYAGSAEPCPGGVFDDVDDLVFTTR
ncbi:kelch repeat-containing protein [Vitiosangium sp. GDMCC 1.1324]|uniref:Kelch repeat-containing protein n=1 Tax=Vitiosangium sp. (strain GDMCC 1.1324) TaxID=2138576 RepID=UPI0018EE53CD|nr:kelch repeat-containing protein [Vitiosangium sp. GDMCC 1.1324]